MAKSDPLRDPKLKVERAKAHIKDAQKAAVAFVNSKPYRMFEDVEPGRAENYLKVHLWKPIPPVIVLASADAIHNLRTSLDQLACALAIKNGATNVVDTYFPFGRDAKSFVASAKKKIAKLSPAAAACIEALKPYHGGNDLLWTIHELDLVDKHRSLVPMALVNTKPADITGLDISGGLSLAAPEWKPLKESVTVATIARGAHPQGNLKVPLEIAFGEGAFMGKPIVATLNKAADLVETILLTFQKRFF